MMYLIIFNLHLIHMVQSICILIELLLLPHVVLVSMHAMHQGLSGRDKGQYI